MPDEPEATKPTGARKRVLEFLAGRQGWTPLVELDEVRRLQADDIATVPSLVEDGLIEHGAEAKAVRITEAGRQALGA